ncbi:hypothetical protein ACFQO8_11395 [Exiguobacterium aestuarii]|uniref:YtkA-like domain-containing protein n=1 Tax=Exiguobacterium aestuarii TaxID=273527 RepID=A0ABW2PMP4_9BACL|nr:MULTISPECIES: hypothetical protein [Exiguobacterium]MCT4787265.1 hypothetical protein [Exiguobacterium aestuarii]
MKRFIQVIPVIMTTLWLGACQLQTVDRSIDPIGIQLIVPERVEVGSTTLAMKVSNDERVTESHIQVTPYESEETRTYEVTEKDGYLVTSVKLDQGIYQVNGMVHEGQKVYTPTTWMIVGDVPQDQIDQIEQSTVQSHGHGGGHHH